MKTISRIISTAVLVALTVAILYLAGQFPEFFAQWYPKVSQGLLGALGTVSAVVRLPLWEIGAALLIVWAIYSLVRALMKGKILRWLSGILWGAAFLLFAFVLLWGAGHKLPTKTESIVTLKASSVEDLTDTTRYFAQKLDEIAPRMQRGEDGKVLLHDFDTLTEQAALSYSLLAEKYTAIPKTANLTAKQLLIGDLFGYLGITGVFVPVTAEATVSPHTYPSALPYTIAHEMGHRLGACAEEDANFLAFLACVNSEDAQLRYSAYFNAFIYCYNALYRTAPATAVEIYKAMTDLSRSDVALATEHYAPYEGKVQETADKLNDAYLKAAGQEAGVQSYGLVSDALIAWYLEKAR